MFSLVWQADEANPGFFGRVQCSKPQKLPANLPANLRANLVPVMATNLPAIFSRMFFDFCPVYSEFLSALPPKLVGVLGLSFQKPISGRDSGTQGTLS